MGEGAVDLGIAGLGPATPFARGGFATVYRAEQLSLRRPVAVKVLFAPPEDQVSFRRFERECHTLGVVSNHPNIVVVHDGGVTDDGRPYLIMEYRAGGSLADVLADEGPLDPARVRDVGLKIGEALIVAHEAGVIHRDVKPANILLSASGEPALADFGIARIDGGHRTTSGQISASVAHAAREVLSGGEPSVQSDVYSLGSTLLELGTGCTPYERHDDSTVWQLINRIMNEPPADAAAAGLPASLAAVVNRALDPDLTSRYATAAELRNELLAIDGDRLATMRFDPRATLAPPPLAVPPGEPSGEPTTTVTAGAGSAPRTGRRRFRSRRVAMGIVAAALLGVVVAALVLTGFGGLRDSDPPVELEFSQALVEPLTIDRSYALGVRNAPPGATFQLLVDDLPVGQPTDDIVVYRGETGRHRVAVEVTQQDGSTERTEPVEVYVSPESSVGGYRANLGAVRIAPTSWPKTLARFDELLAEGHDDLALSVGGTGDDFWVFYVDGFGDDADTAWAYCERFSLVPDDCYAADVPVEDK